MLFDNSDYDYEISFFKIPGSDFNEITRKDKFVSVEEGFLRGNMFKDEYDSYKNLKPGCLNPETEKDCILYKLMAYSFAINDLNLYLDLNPDDQNTLDMFKNIVKEKNKTEDIYVEKYGPMTVDQTNGKIFNWVKNPWPWDNDGGTKYV